jgi:hypothetical protein
MSTDQKSLFPRCIGEGFLISQDAAEIIADALREYKTDSKIMGEQIASVAKCFETVLEHKVLAVRPFDKKKSPNPKMPEWDYKDEIVERHLRALRRIAYAIGQIRALLSSVPGLNNLSAVKTIEDSCSEALDARRLVIQETLGADCEVPTKGVQNLVGNAQNPDNCKA